MADATTTSNPKPRAITPRVALPKVVPGQQLGKDGKKAVVAAAPAASPATAVVGRSGDTQSQSQGQNKAKGTTPVPAPAGQGKGDAGKERERQLESINGVDGRAGGLSNGVLKSAVPPEGGWSVLVGSRVSITNNLSRVLTGEVYSCDKEILVLETGEQDYHIVPLGKISKYEILRSEEKKGSSAEENVAKERERARQAKLREERLAKPAGVSNAGHRLFLALDKTLPVRWHEKTIIVLDNVLIEPPYEVENCKAPAKHAKQLERVKDLVRLEKEKASKDPTAGRRGG